MSSPFREKHKEKSLEKAKAMRGHQKTLGWILFHKSSALCARCKVVRVFMQQRSLLSLFFQSERHGVVGHMVVFRGPPPERTPPHSLMLPS